MKILIIGGGASGLFAAGILSQRGEDVTILEKNEKCGKKIYITGKGRCNLTNNCSSEEFLNNVVNGNKFLMSAAHQFSPQDTINFFQDLGLKIKTERGNRVFPVSDKASDVTKALLSNINKDNCKIKLDEQVLSIEKKGNSFNVKTNKETYFAYKVIVPTGGKSYPATGSTGDGYKIAKSFGINVINPHSALVPIKIKGNICSRLEGLSLKNVTLKAVIGNRKKDLFGEMLFTADAISGPIALSLSSFIGQEKVVSLSIDFKPALDNQTLDKRLLRDFQEGLNKNIGVVLKGLLPSRLVDVFLERVKIPSDIKVNSVTKEMRESIVMALKDFKLDFDGLYPVEAGIVTAGGVDLKEINPKTMESKKISGLYFVGEVLDIDCLTGGFNLQACFSTSYACAMNLE